MKTDIEGGVPLVPKCLCTRELIEKGEKPDGVQRNGHGAYWMWKWRRPSNCPRHGARIVKHIPAVWVNRAAY